MSDTRPPLPPGQKNLFRTVHTANFTTLPNALLRDKRLSFKARGIIALIFTNVDEWEVQQGWISNQGTEGREAIASAFKELESHGYAIYSEAREGGRFLRCVWTFHDHPVDPQHRTNRSKWKDGSPQDGKPCHGKPCDGKPCHGNPTTKKEHQEEKTSEERQSAFALFPTDAPSAKSEKPKKPQDLTDPEWLEWLKAQPAYAGINVDIELSKLDVWLTTKRGRGKQKTRSRITAWLNGVDRPITEPTTMSTTTKPKGPAL